MAGCNKKKINQDTLIPVVKFGLHDTTLLTDAMEEIEKRSEADIKLQECITDMISNTAFIDNVVSKVVEKLLNDGQFNTRGDKDDQIRL